MMPGPESTSCKHFLRVVVRAASAAGVTAGLDWTVNIHDLDHPNLGQIGQPPPQFPEQK